MQGQLAPVVQAVHVVNPVNLSVVKTITQDQDGNTLSNVGSYGGGLNISRSWNDAVLAEVSLSVVIPCEAIYVQ